MVEPPWRSRVCRGSPSPKTKMQRTARDFIWDAWRASEGWAQAGSEISYLTDLQRWALGLPPPPPGDGRSHLPGGWEERPLLPPKGLRPRRQPVPALRGLFDPDPEVLRWLEYIESQMGPDSPDEDLMTLAGYLVEDQAWGLLHCAAFLSLETWDEFRALTLDIFGGDDFLKSKLRYHNYATIHSQWVKYPFEQWEE